MSYDIKLIQKSLVAKGFGPLAIDGVFGPMTSFAVRAFKRSVGLADRDFVGPITYARLTDDTNAIQVAVANTFTAPWFAEMAKMIGKHESKNHAEVAAWLKSDGSTVGDPARIPWCGDGMQTAIKNTLVDEPLPENPYAAINWLKFGKAVAPQRCSILVFHRGNPDSWQGHIGQYAGESEDNYYVLGCNQSNSVTIAPIAKSRLREGGSRWPLTGGISPSGQTLIMSGGVRSTNEV